METGDASVEDTSEFEEDSMLVESQDELLAEPVSVQPEELLPSENDQSAGEAGLHSGRMWSAPYKLADFITNVLFVCRHPEIIGPVTHV